MQRPARGLGARVEMAPTPWHRRDAMRSTLLLAALLTLTAPVDAPAIAVDCPGAMTTVAMTDCFVSLGKAADEELRQSLEGLTGSLRTPTGDEETRRWNEKTVQLLSQSQEAWRSYRENYCAAVAASFSTGSMAGVASASCFLRVTRARVRELQEWKQDSADAQGGNHAPDDGVRERRAATPMR